MMLSPPPRRCLGPLLAALLLTPSAPAAAAVALPTGATLEAVDFERHVMGLVGRAGCNLGSCHGSFQGKGGFRLSLFGFDPDKDFSPVSQISAGTVVCCVNKDAQRKNGWTDFRRLVSWMKENPDALRFGTAGVGTTAHFVMAAVQKATGAKALMVTYRGGAPAVADLQAGVIDMMFELTPGLMPLIEQGVVSPLAVGSAKRVGALPDVPGMAEFADIGLGGVDINAWEALMAPAGMAPDVAARLNASVRQAGEDSAMREKLRASGFSVETSESPDALAAKIRREIPYWRKLVEDSGAKLDV